MSWFINGIKEWSTGITTTFNTSKSTTTTFSTSKSTTTTFNTSRSTTTTFSTSRSTTRSTSVSTTPAQNNAANSGYSVWIKYAGNGGLYKVQANWNEPGEGTTQQNTDPNVTSFTGADGKTYHRGNIWSDPAYHGSCCGGINFNYYNIAYRTSSNNTSFSTTFNTSKSTTTTFSTSRSTTTTFNTSRSTTTTFSTSRATERTTDFYA
jgi:hypothetical protein